MITQLFSMEAGVGYLANGGPYWFLSPFAAIILLLMIAYIVFMDNGERRIPVQYAKRVVGRKMYGGQSTHIPIKVNLGGVMPIIFASSILSLPPTIKMFVSNRLTEDSPWNKWFFDLFDQTHWVYAIIYFVMIIGFAYFYASITYNPVEMSNNIRKQSGTIPGIRPGEPTAAFIRKILGKITLLGALMISVVAIFPIIFSQLTTLVLDKAFGFPQGMNISLGGTSIIILVGVALETVKQMESQMMMRHYRGFLD
jgi:preprotein translocase subunit SecY